MVIDIAVAAVVVACGNIAIALGLSEVLVSLLQMNLAMAVSMRRWTVLASDMASVRVWVREAEVTCAGSWRL